MCRRLSNEIVVHLGLEIFFFLIGRQSFMAYKVKYDIHVDIFEIVPSSILGLVRKQNNQFRIVNFLSIARVYRASDEHLDMGFSLTHITC